MLEFGVIRNNKQHVGIVIITQQEGNKNRKHKPYKNKAELMYELIICIYSNSDIMLF